MVLYSPKPRVEIDPTVLRMQIEYDYNKRGGDDGYPTNSRVMQAGQFGAGSSPDDSNQKFNRNSANTNNTLQQNQFRSSSSYSYQANNESNVHYRQR